MSSPTTTRPLRTGQVSPLDEKSSQETFLTKKLRPAVSTSISKLRPFSPQIVPVFVFFLLLPLLIFLSVYAGWTVWSNVAVSWQVPLYLQYGDGGPPYAFTPLPALSSQQKYDVFIDLTLPTSESNLAIGNFMNTLVLTSPSNTTLASARRPAIAIAPKKLYRNSEWVSISVLMLDAFVAGMSRVNAYVELGRRDAWKSLGNGQAHEISVISATLRGKVIRHGIRGFASRFPFFLALLSGIAFFAILLLISAACIFPTLFRKRAGDQDEHDIQPEIFEDATFTEEEQKPTKRRRRFKSSRSSSRTLPVKSEERATARLSRRSTESLRRRQNRAPEPETDSDR